MIKAVQMNKEVIVNLQNKVGALDYISKILTERGINIEAIAGYIKEGTGQAEIRLVTDNDTITVDTLKKNDITEIREKQILLVDLQNKPGALRVLTSKLDEEGLDLKCIYSTTCVEGCCQSCRMVIDTCDNQKAMVVLTP